jgi:hypothetical protein
MEEEKQYFIWEPYEGAEHKEKITITDFKINPLEKYSDRKVLRGVKVSGLIKIAIEGYSGEADNDEKYNIEFKGRMKMINNESEIEKPEIEKALRKHYNEASRNCMRSKREKQYKKEVETYFPKENLSNKLNGGEIDRETLKEIICDILDEKKELTNTKKFRIYHSPFWAKAIEESMNVRGYVYVKEGDKYVKRIE